jgi:hypothetical protein
MRPRLTLIVGIGLILLGSFLYALSSVFVTIYTVSSGSYWTYYEYQYTTHSEYQCVGLGTGTLCTFFYCFAYGGAVALYLTGAVMMAVSLHRLIEGHRLG